MIHLREGLPISRCSLQSYFYLNSQRIFGTSNMNILAVLNYGQPQNFIMGSCLISVLGSQSLLPTGLFSPSLFTKHSIISCCISDFYDCCIGVVSLYIILQTTLISLVQQIAILDTITISVPRCFLQMWGYCSKNAFLVNRCI